MSLLNDYPANPHAIIELKSESGLVIYDSWQQKSLFQNVKVELTTNESSMSEISLFDPNFKIIDTFTGKDDIPQADVRVFMGYGKDLGEPVFKGLLAYVERGQANSVFTAFDMGYKMKLEKRAGYKNKKDDLKIIGDLAKRNKLEFEGPEKALKLEPNKALMQDEQTDWQWAMERARDAGLVLFVREDTLFAKYPAKVAEKADLTLVNRLDFIMKRDFDFVYHTPESKEGRPQVITRRGRGKGGKRVEGKSSKGKRGRKKVVLKKDIPGKATKKKLSKRAIAQKELEREHAFEGHLTCNVPVENKLKMDIRKTVDVREVGKLFSGKYLTDQVTYNFSPGRLEMILGLYRDKVEK